jgi:pyruvate formate lyase activating enzyme
MNGIIFDLQKYAVHDGPGIRTTVFLKGCPLDCWWCHNPESRSPGIELPAGGVLRKRSLLLKANGGAVGREISADDVMREVEKDSVFYDESGGGVTFSGGEPMMQPDFLRALLERSKDRGIHTAVDTSGYCPYELFDAIYDLTDLFLFDLKPIDDGEHLRYTGVSNRLIHDNLNRLTRRGDKVLPRIPLIPGVTDTAANLRAAVRLLGALEHVSRVDLLPYNRIGENKYDVLRVRKRMPLSSTQSERSLAEMRAVFTSAGFDVA